MAQRKRAKKTAAKKAAKKRKQQIPHRKYDPTTNVTVGDLKMELLMMVPDERWAPGKTLHEHVRELGRPKAKVSPLTEEQAIYCAQFTAKSIKPAPGAPCNRYVKRAISDAWHFCNGTGGGTPAVWQLTGRPINGHGYGLGGHAVMLARLTDESWLLLDVSFARSADVASWAVDLSSDDLGLYINNRL